jgi:hypothetical protein
VERSTLLVLQGPAHDSGGRQGRSGREEFRETRMTSLEEESVAPSSSDAARGRLGDTAARAAVRSNEEANIVRP